MFPVPPLPYLADPNIALMLLILGVAAFSWERIVSTRQARVPAPQRRVECEECGLAGATPPLTSPQHSVLA